MGGGGEGGVCLTRACAVGPMGAVGFGVGARADGVGGSSQQNVPRQAPAAANTARGVFN